MAEIPLANVTTTNTVEGWGIDAYLGPVVSSLVVGAGLVTEFFAGFTDVFGGRSQSVSNRLAELYRDASLDLRRKASHSGANWIIGYRVDFDEISGKNSFMFMLTASGTAVKASKRTSTTTGANLSASVPAADLAVMIARLAMIKNEVSAFDRESGWQFAIEHRVAELAPAMVTWLGNSYKGLGSEFRKAKRAKSVAYLAGIAIEDATAAIYGGLLGNDDEARAALDLMQDLSLMDLTRTCALLKHREHRIRRLALQTIRADQPSYDLASAALMEELEHLITAGFPDLSQSKEVKGLLGRKQVWICQCGAENEQKITTWCGKCRRNKQGFEQGDFLPEEAVAALRLRREALVAALESRRGST